MLTVLGFGMVVVFMYAIITTRLSPMVALIVIPMLFALLGGFAGAGIGAMMLDGLRTLAPTGVMLMFAILYFGIMIDAGLFEPLVKVILRAVGGDPLRVVMGTALLAAFVSLDGDGSTTYMITVAALLPLYQRLGIHPLNLTCVTLLAGGVMNLTPWGGPLARAASALHVDPLEIFMRVLPSMAAGLIGVFGLAYVLGRRERRRLGIAKPEVRRAVEPVAAISVSSASCVTIGADEGLALAYAHVPAKEASRSQSVSTLKLAAVESGGRPAHTEEASCVRRPKLLWFNALLTAGLMVALITAVLPLPVLFMAALAIALVANYPQVEEQRRRIAAHSKNVIAVVSLIYAAGIFTGILSGTGMVEAMSKSFLSLTPDSWAPYLAPITALASLPFTFFISNDAFYFGVLPVMAEAANVHGISDAQMAAAALMGQPVHLLSPLVPSTYLLVGLAGVDFGDHQRFTLKWAIMICFLMSMTALLFGVFPFVSG